MVLSHVLGCGVVAVVGASRDESKYGFKVFKQLLEIGVEVYPVNPGIESLLDVKAYPGVSDIPADVSLVITVVPPNVTEAVSKDFVASGVKWVWMQPGSESENAIKYLEDNGVRVTYKQCMLVAVKLMQDDKKIRGEN